MNQTLWNKIQTFDLDNPQGEYGFSSRVKIETLCRFESSLQVDWL